MAIVEQFDPTSDLFVAQFARPAGLQPVNMRALSPMQRALLVIDGTVTKFLEAYLLEPIEVVRLGQGTQTLAADNEWLDVAAGTEVIARHVMLQGRYNRELRAYAVSLIVPDRVPLEVTAGLDDDGGSLGRILLSSAVETRREILWFGKEHDVDLPPEVAALSDGMFITRAYRIIMGGEPIMLISEKFPSRPERLESFD